MGRGDAGGQIHAGGRLPGAVHLLNWLRHYLETTPDSRLVWVPWIDFKEQPACTVGPGTEWTRTEEVVDQAGAVSKRKHKVIVRGAVSPERWTRDELAFWARLLDGSPQEFPGLNDPKDALKLLQYYRHIVESK